MKDYIQGITPLKQRNIITRKTNRKCFIKLNSNPKTNFKTQDSILHPMTRKTRRVFTYERHIDLHGLSIDKAFNELIRFFETCKTNNIRKVIVITGGNAIRNTPLRAAFQKWARESFGQYIVSYSSANLKHGGDGAFYVILKS